MPQYARVSVNIAQLTGLFDYEVPTELENLIQPGVLVTVPFGKQVAQGIVVETPAEPAVSEIKYIETVLDPEPVLTSYQLKLAERMAEDNLATLPQCLDLMVPPGLSQHADLQLQRTGTELTDGLTPVQLKLIRLLEKRGPLRGRQVDVAMPKIAWRESLVGLVRRGLVESQSILPPPAVRPKVIRTVQFSAPGNSREDPALALSRVAATAQRRRLALEFLEGHAIPVSVAWVYAESGVNSADLNALAEKGLVRLGETEVWRDPLEKLKPVFTAPPLFTPDQERAWSGLLPQLTDPARRKPNLLVGVTGSGKTEIYLRAAGEMLASGKGVFILVPEISLTAQTVKRFFARFPGRVALVHSKLSAGERYDTWRRIRSGELPIVIGARSALFSPLPDPGLIVIDEAHDDSYNQEDTQPHYRSVKTAISLSRLTDACLLLGSATPGVETRFLFDEMDWNILGLPNRVLGHVTSADGQPAYTDMPAMEVVDMRQELTAGNRSAVSRSLHNALSEVLSRNEQAILFLNRRGSASYVFCRECGYVLRCPRCDTQLTWHAEEAALICHTCNYRRGLPAKCPSCGSANIRQFGMGTESLEKFVSSEFPEARLLRWDADAVRYKGAHDLILDHFIQRRADILVGTQMIAKGLDLPLVTRVGVVLADISLNLPDFRAAERTFQLLTQVAGRAGRSDRPGRVIIQTFQPGHYAIRAAAAYDADGFYRDELAFRQKTGYPPYSRLLKIEFRHTNALVVQKATTAAGEQLRFWLETGGFTDTSLIGPVPCFYQRRAGLYRWQIVLRGSDPARILIEHPLATWQPPGMIVDATIDPGNLL